MYDDMIRYDGYMDDVSEKDKAWEAYYHDIDLLLQQISETDELDTAHIKAKLRIYGERYDKQTVVWSNKVVQDIDDIDKKYPSSTDDNDGGASLKSDISSVLSTLLSHIDERRVRHHQAQESRQQGHGAWQQVKADKQYENATVMTFTMMFIATFLACITSIATKGSYYLSIVSYALMLPSLFISGFALISKLSLPVKFRINAILFIICSLCVILAMVVDLI